MIARLNPLIRGWANYHRNQVAKAIFRKVDHLIWEQLWKWACRRHPNKPLRWIKDRYFIRQGLRNWVFGTMVVGEDGERKDWSNWSTPATPRSDAIPKSRVKQIRLTLPGNSTSRKGLA